jgi:hypothetical protein
MHTMNGHARRSAIGRLACRALGALAAVPILLAAAAPQQTPHPERAPMFTLREEHLKVLRQAIAIWAPIESGAPGVMISPALLDEDKNLLNELATRAGLAWTDPPTAAQRHAAERLFEEMRPLPSSWRTERSLPDLTLIPIRWRVSRTSKRCCRRSWQSWQGMPPGRSRSRRNT